MNIHTHTPSGERGRYVLKIVTKYWEVEIKRDIRICNCCICYTDNVKV